MEELKGHNIKQVHQIKVEEGLYLAAIGLALLVRVLILGRLMLTELEAGYAWQAFQVSQGETIGLANHPAYVLITGLLFFIFHQLGHQ